ncbi:mechanosensitive ion channel family protein, partial [Pseudomonadota bacterium]
SGWILMWERPIRIGDFLEVGEMVGTVEAINTRSTRIKRTDGVRILVPNSQLLENTVVNWTLVDRTMRSVVRVGVQYGTDVAKVKRLLEGMLAEDPDILIEPEPNVVFEDFGDSALIFDAYFWIETSNERGLRGVRSNLRFAIDRVFRENDIVIAYPQRDVHIDGAIRIAKENS